jgi:hypothetical protein
MDLNGNLLLKENCRNMTPFIDGICAIEREDEQSNFIDEDLNPLFENWFVYIDFYDFEDEETAFVHCTPNRDNSSGTKASSFLNIRSAVSDIKKRLYETSQQLLFEQNTDVLWLNFKSQVTPLLDNMVSNYILSDYKLTKYNIDPDSGDPVPAYMVLASLKIMPINSVEVFDLTIQLENNEISVAEEE